MAKKKKNQEKTLPANLNYKTQAEPRAVTADGVPVFCSHDKLIPAYKAIPNPRNPNQHSERQIAMLGNIIQSNGWRQPITISRRSGFVVKGHGRLSAALKKGWTEIPVDYQEYASDAEEWSDLIADNRLAELSEIDNKLLLDLIGEIGGDAPLELTGFDQDDIQAIIDAVNDMTELGDESADDGADTVTDPESEPAATRTGDLWILGNHRLLCGDVTDEAAVERLMRGERAELVNTDPPYGVNYISASGRFDAIANDNRTGDDLMNNLLIPAFRAYVKYTSDDAAFYIWHASSTRRDFEDALNAVGLIEKQYIIWAKNTFVLGHADYQWGHEPCFYAEKAGHAAHWYGDRTQNTVWRATLRDESGTATTLTGGIILTDDAGNALYLSAEPPKGKKIRRIRLSKGRSAYLSRQDGKAADIWEVARDSHTDHPTQKPVELAVRAIANSTKPGDLVLDFFGGSGSTLRAAEMTGRRCYTMELDPRYCDVIIKSYIALTGDKNIFCERDGEQIPVSEILDL